MLKLLVQSRTLTTNSNLHALLDVARPVAAIGIRQKWHQGFDSWIMLSDPCLANVGRDSGDGLIPLLASEGDGGDLRQFHVGQNCTQNVVVVANDGVDDGVGSCHGVVGHGGR